MLLINLDFDSFIKAEETSSAILMNELSVFGFVSANHYDQWPNAFVEINKLIQEVILYNQITVIILKL